jgi:putative SOS response-associated peptidase YedK
VCGRFAFYSPHESVVRLFPVQDVPPMLARYNIAPTQFVATVRQLDGETPQVAFLRWGLIPFWSKDKAIGNRLINARGETVHEKPAFRAAFRKRRCLVLADGFYEWRVTDAGKEPHYIYLRSEEPFAMAGLWESWDDGVGDKPLQTCTIVTTGPNEMMQTLHRRMPVILHARDYAAWLDPQHPEPADLRSLLVPFESKAMAHRRVGRAVNNPRNDEPSLVEGVDASDNPPAA